MRKNAQYSRSMAIHQKKLSKKMKFLIVRLIALIYAYDCAYWEFSFLEVPMRRGLKPLARMVCFVSCVFVCNVNGTDGCETITSFTKNVPVVGLVFTGAYVVSEFAKLCCCKCSLRYDYDSNAMYDLLDGDEEGCRKKSCSASKKICKGALLLVNLGTAVSSVLALKWNYWPPVCSGVAVAAIGISSIIGNGVSLCFDASGIFAYCLCKKKLNKWILESISKRTKQMRDDAKTIGLQMPV